jgi:hypothetical protein
MEQLERGKRTSHIQAVDPGKRRSILDHAPEIVSQLSVNRDFFADVAL